MLGLFLLLPVLALHARELPDYTPVLLGLAMGAYGLTQALLQIPFGRWSDRFGRKPVIAVGHADRRVEHRRQYQRQHEREADAGADDSHGAGAHLRPGQVCQQRRHRGGHRARALHTARDGQHGNRLRQRADQ